MRALLLGLVHNANVGKLQNVHPQGKRVIHPLLYLSEGRVINCLRDVKRTCIASDAGLRSRCAHGGVHLGLLPVVRRVGPSIGRDVLGATRRLSSTTSVCGVNVRRTGLQIGAPRNVDVNTLERRTTPRAILFRVLRPLKFGTTRMESVYQALSKRPNGIFTAPN